jgi:hypothetical protein
VATLILAVSVMSSMGALALALTLLLSHATDLLPKLLACLLLIDQGVITVLFLRLPVTVPPSRLAVRIGSIGISIAGILLFVWNAIPRGGDLNAIVPLMAIVMVAQGLLTWRYLATKNDATTKAPGASR